jgi:hypothetical protein
MSTLSDFIKKVNNITRTVRTVKSAIDAVRNLRNQFGGSRSSRRSSTQFKPLGLSRVSPRSSGRNVNPKPVRPASPSRTQTQSKIR